MRILSVSTNPFLFRRLWPIALCIALLTGCGDGLPNPDQRPIPAQLAEEQREQWRRLPLADTLNTRDLGGYRTADGRKVRWGLLYRTDNPADLGDRDIRYLQRLGLKRLVDFRSVAERHEEPVELPGSFEIVHLPMKVTVEGQEMRDLFRDPEALSRYDSPQLMRNVNRQLVATYTPKYRRWLHSLANEDSSSPQMFYCSAGKDRTGLAAALLLLILGVPEQTVMNDYLLSAKYYDEEFPSIARMIRIMSLGRLDPEKLQPLMTVRRDYIEAAYAEMKNRYGSVDGYIRNGLDITAELREKLQNRFLEY